MKNVPRGLSSRPVEFHHQPLTKPCLRLSPHTAFHSDQVVSLREQPLSVEIMRFLLVSQLTKIPHLALSPSSLDIHYRRFNATTGRSAIFRCIDISPSRFALIGFLLASPEDFSCSVLEPESASRHLYTGHRMVNKQVLSMLILGRAFVPSSDVVFELSMRSQWFICIRLSDPYMTGSSRLLTVSFTTAPSPV
jgi:hypothetical protein